MSKLENLPIFFVSIETLVNTYKKDGKIDFSQLGIITSKKIILTQILYSNKSIINKPYTLFIDKMSYIKQREKIIQFIIDDIIIPKYQLGQSLATLYSNISYVIQFVNWLNYENISIINNTFHAKEIFINFTQYLKESIRLGTKKQSTAHVHHNLVLKLLRYLMNDLENHIGSNIQIIPNTRINKTFKSSKEEQEYHFNFYYNLFHQLTDFLLEKQLYPLKLNLPSNEVWIIPSSYVYITEQTKAPRAFNFFTGKVKSIEELKKEYGYRNYVAKECRNGFIDNLEKHNTDFDSEKRMFLGTTALSAFYMMFLSITGMNDSTAATLPWNDSYEVSKDKQKFRNIKYRAGNKIVEFQIQSKFMKDFHKYLKLRSYLLGEKIFNYLFFADYGLKANIDSNRIKSGGLSNHINTSMRKKLDKNLPQLSSRILRVNKTHQVIKEDGIIAASQLAQSSIDTIISTYQGESFDSSKGQISTYFNSLNQHIFNVKNTAIETSIGFCNQPNNPLSEFKFTNKNIDCSQKEGCLFCQQYALHSDKNDIKKILSLNYVINESKYVAKNIEHFNSIYGVVLERINNILDEIHSLNTISSDLIDGIYNDVFVNQNLHPYWEHKLNILIEMGVLK